MNTMRTLQSFQYFAAMLAAALCTACADDDFMTEPLDSGEAVSLVSSKLPVITRSGAENFQEGSEYRLFAVQHPEGYASDAEIPEAKFLWETQIKMWNSVAMYNMVGVETAAHTIEYNNGVNFNYTTGTDKLDFFAIAVDKVDATHSYALPEISSTRQDGVSPTVQWALGTCSADENRPGDLMFSNDQKEKTYQDGTVMLNFRHALTRFTFEAAVQDESDYTDKWLKDNVTLTGIEVHNTHQKGTFNICTGKWTYTADDEEKESYTAACDAANLGQLLTTSAEEVGGSLLLFPNNDEVLTMVVKLHFKTKPEGQAFSTNTERVIVTMADGGGYDVTVTTPLTLGEVEDVSTEDGAKDGTAVEFASNYSYKFSIVVMRNDVRVLAIVPTVYNWIDATLDNETVVGQPVTFGGLMWMDRNLGASTWDAENDFYGSIGYYYQYGRNIPYILDTLKFTHYVDDNDVDPLQDSDEFGFPVIMPTAKDDQYVVLSTTNSDYSMGVYYAWRKHDKTPTEEEKEQLEREQVESFYTYYSTNEGDTVCGYTYIANKNVRQPFRYVGEVIYDEKGEIDIDETKKYHRFSVIPASGQLHQAWTYADNYARYNWAKDVNDQPCPKGWRLPKRSELYEFMPWRSSGQYIKWANTYPKNLSNISGDNFYHKGWTQDIRYGKIANPDGSTYNVVYMLNRKGTEDAYRIRIMSHFSKGYLDRENYSKNKRYITIERYSADPSNDINYYFESDKKTEKASEWDTPIETMIYPCAGYIVTDKMHFDLRTFGTGSVLRTDSANVSNNASSWVQYLSLSNMSVSVNANSRRSLGDQVRCCRDLTATK
jgi:hypothetical protein